MMPDNLAQTYPQGVCSRAWRQPSISDIVPSHRKEARGESEYLNKFGTRPSLQPCGAEKRVKVSHTERRWPGLDTEAQV